MRKEECIFCGRTLFSLDGRFLVLFADGPLKLDDYKPVAMICVSCILSTSLARGHVYYHGPHK